MVDHSCNSQAAGLIRLGSWSWKRESRASDLSDDSAEMRFEPGTSWFKDQPLSPYAHSQHSVQEVHHGCFMQGVHYSTGEFCAASDMMEKRINEKGLSTSICRSGAVKFHTSHYREARKLKNHSTTSVGSDQRFTHPASSYPMLAHKRSPNRQELKQVWHHNSAQFAFIQAIILRKFQVHRHVCL